MNPSQQFEDDLGRVDRGELEKIHRYIKWQKFLCSLKPYRMLLKITGIHTLLATLQLSLYPSGENQLMETGIWVASYGLVISTVYFTSRSSRRRNKPKAAHWVK